MKKEPTIGFLILIQRCYRPSLMASPCHHIWAPGNPGSFLMLLDLFHTKETWNSRVLHIRRLCNSKHMANASERKLCTFCLRTQPLILTHLDICKEQLNESFYHYICLYSITSDMTRIPFVISVSNIHLDLTTFSKTHHVVFFFFPLSFNLFWISSHMTKYIPKYFLSYDSRYMVNTYISYIILIYFHWWTLLHIRFLSYRPLLLSL